MIDRLNSPRPGDKSKKWLFTRILDPDVCRVDNCARFMRLHGEDDIDIRDIDALSGRIMRRDEYPFQELGSAETELCWTDNTYDPPDGVTEPYSAQVFCDVCTDFYDWGDPVPSTCHIGDARTEDVPGYQRWYRNEDQKDADRDGIGDVCTPVVILSNLEQDHAVRRRWSGTWDTREAWEAFAASADIDWSRPDDPRELPSGLPIRNWDDWGTSPIEMDFPRLCGIECGAARGCKVRKYQAVPEQRFSFDVAGFSDEGSVVTTLGACACERASDSQCYDSAGRCWRPEDDGWRTDPVTYEMDAGDSEFDLITLRTRYPGYRHFANRTPALYGRKEVAQPCQPHVTLHPWFDPGLVIDLGWDENAASIGDGCQEMSMIFEASDRRELTWGYIHQVEPDPLLDCMSGPTPSACWDAWDRSFPQGKGEQLWMDARTTAMRVGIEAVGPELRRHWLRQWHTPIYPRDPEEYPDDPIEGSTRDRDRPVAEPPPEGEPYPYPDPETRGFGRSETTGEVGLVYFEPICGDLEPMGFYEVDGPAPWTWEDGASPDEAADSGPVARVIVKSDRTAVTIESAQVSKGSGEVFPRSATYELAEPVFPDRAFAMLRLVLNRRTAATLFGFAGSGSTAVVDLVVGGTDAAGRPSGDVWISRGWERVARFERLLPGSGPPAIIAADKPPPDAPFGLAAPRVVVDTNRNRLLIVGGRTVGGVPLDRIMVFDLATRSWTTSAGKGSASVPLPPDAALGELAVDHGRRRAYLVGTGPGGPAVYEIQFGLPEPYLRRIPTTGPRPAPRTGAAVTYADRLGRVLLFGGALDTKPAGVEEPAGAAGGPVVDAAAGAATFLGDVWGFDPEAGSWSLLRTDAGRDVARADATLLAGGHGDAYVVGGRNGLGVLPMDRAFRVDLLDSANAGWRTTNIAEARLLEVDGVPHQTSWRPGDPVLYALTGGDLRFDLTTPVQRKLAAAPNALGMTIASATSRAAKSVNLADVTAVPPSRWCRASRTT